MVLEPQVVGGSGSKPKRLIVAWALVEQIAEVDPEKRLTRAGLAVNPEIFAVGTTVDT
jgi:hypothetical protein